MMRPSFTPHLPHLASAALLACTAQMARFGPSGVLSPSHPGDIVLLVNVMK